MLELEKKYNQEAINNAFRLGNFLLESGASKIEIQDQLQTDGCPADLAEMVAQSMLEIRNERTKNQSENYVTIGLALVALAVILFAMPIIFEFDVFFIHYGSLLAGVIFLIAGRSKRKESKAEN